MLSKMVFAIVFLLVYRKINLPPDNKKADLVAKSASVSLQFSSHTPTSFFKHDGGCVNARFLPRDKSDRYGG